NQESRLPPGSDFRRWVWITIAPFVTVLRAATYLVSRNTALVFRYRGSGRTATTGEVFLV
ncbi:hypothetical protein U4U87_19380, partial [Escherichia coli]|nr:hypothetical protein [Escherichia coli]MDZ6423977.1 hypothetical protein [Escherichia coli]